MDKLKSVNFKNGDLVIAILGSFGAPFIGTVVTDNSKGDYPVCLAKNGITSGHYFNKAGLLHPEAARPSIFHATPENIAAVNQLYGCDLKLPMTPNEIIKAMLDRGDKFVVARVSDKSFDDARVNLIEPIIVERVNSAAQLPIRTFQDVGWFFGIPIDPRTGLEITEADLEAQS